MLLLVSDANILIDMEVADLLVSMFSMEWDFIIPDILFEEELREQHGHMLGLGLKPIALSSDSMLRLLSLSDLYRRPSRNDLMALSLAQQEKCSLLTGDRHLKETAEKENIAVHGTIWLVEQLVEQGKINVSAAIAAYEKMEQTGRRLPWKKAHERLAKIIDEGWD